MIVPGLIGPKENFVNLRGYLSFNYSHLNKSMVDLENKFIHLMSKESIKYQNELSDELSKTKDLFRNEFKLNED